MIRVNKSLHLVWLLSILIEPQERLQPAAQTPTSHTELARSAQVAVNPTDSRSAFEIIWYSISEGGGSSRSDEFTLQATLDSLTRPEASLGNTYALFSGFWARTLRDRDAETLIFLDGFESGDLSKWN